MEENLECEVEKIISEIYENHINNKNYDIKNYEKIVRTFIKIVQL